ncbi:hypothetical protein QFC20_000733 [Naganishia adeliensis]|uniref:Uncharacterized protein n=1 Tax=Naganishia adeliensis TaxID=92952 RepID=A0ACC2WXL6_9TREE|nr:hypothetical protein QFC20_000733 [Naganishia adeliensis]
MEHFVQGFEAAKNTSMDLLGSFVKLAPGYKPPTATNARDSSSRKRGREDHVQIDATSPEMTSSHTLPSSQKEASTQSEYPNQQSSTSKLLPKPVQNGAPTRVLVSKSNGETSVPAIRDGKGKLGNGPIHSSYAMSSSSNGNPRANRSDAFHHNGGNVTPPSYPGPAKKQKTEHRPPQINENTLKALPNRTQRAQQEAAINSASRENQTKVTTYKGKSGTKRPGVAVKKNGMKGKARLEDIPPKVPEVITLDEDTDEDEVKPQDSHQVPSIVTPETEQTSASVSTSERLNGKATYRPSLQEVAASAASCDLSSLVSQKDDSLSQHLDPTTGSSSRVVLPPPEHLAPPKVEEDGLLETTGYSVGGTESLDARPARKRRNSSQTPTTTNQRLPQLASTPGPGAQTHIAYARTYKKIPRLTERPESPRESPEDYGDPNPAVQEITERPDWMNNPDPVDDGDLDYLAQIPLHLRMNFVALADELDYEEILDYYNCGVEDYLEFRGWADQAIQRSSGPQNTKLTVMHVLAAQKCWRSMRSRQILEAESRGLVFPFIKKRPAEQQEPSEGAPMASESQAGPTVTNTSRPVSNHFTIGTTNDVRP